MAKSDFQFRSPREKSGLGGAIGNWFRGSYKGWKWLLVILSFQVVSAYTNVMGMRLALDWWIAVVLGIGLQTIALYVGIGLINATEEDRAGWKKALIPIVAISVFFSFAGFTSVYSESVERRTLPLRQMDDLKEQSMDLSFKVDEARRLAMSAYQNRIDYASEVKTAVRTREQNGGYPDPISAEKAVNDQDAKVKSAESAKAEWEEFAFDAQAPLSAATVAAGFSQLQDTYGRLGSLVGKLRKEEAASFRMSDPPLPKIAASESAARQDLITQAFGQLFTFSGIFWLVIALFLELIPFWVAHANPAAREVEVEDEDYIMERKMDERLAREVAHFNGMMRPVHMIATNSMADVEGQIARTDPVVEEMRRSVVEAVRLKRLERDTATRQRKLELLVEHARMRGVPDEVIRRIVEEDFNELLKEFGIEDLRHEKIRESRRDQVLADDLT